MSAEQPFGGMDENGLPRIGISWVNSCGVYSLDPVSNRKVPDVNSHDASLQSFMRSLFCWQE